jgi:hypothetical protein
MRKFLWDSDLPVTAASAAFVRSPTAPRFRDWNVEELFRRHSNQITESGILKVGYITNCEAASTLADRTAALARVR